MRRVLSTMVWLARVTAHLTVSHPVATVCSVALGLVGQVAYVLAFLLPLKVILLAGADGVPKYFRPFIDPADKAVAVIVLSVGAVFCYVLSIYCDRLLKNLSGKGSRRILANSNSISIVNNQGDETSDVLQRFARLSSGFLFVALVMGVLAWINLALFAFISVAMLASFLYLASREPASDAGRDSGRAIATKLSLLTTLTFFASFAIVLMPFVLSLPSRNILVAIISFVLVRRVLSILPKLVRSGIKLASERALINALVFPNHKLPRHESGAGQTFRQAFERPARMSRVRAELERAGVMADGAALDVSWVDPESRDFQSFEVRLQGPEGATRLLLKRVLSAGREFLAENERFLFDSLTPEALRAPPLVAEYSQGGFDCLISDIGVVEDDAAPRRGVRDDLLEHYWSIDPGAKLTRAYRASHQLLGERLTEKLVARVGVAVDDDGEVETFEAFRRQLPRLRRQLRAMPLYVYNPHLDTGRIYLGADGRPVVTNWGRWSLEPIGATLPEGDTSEDLAARLARVRIERPSLPKEFGVAHLRLAAAALELERQLERGSFKRALSTMADLLASPLLEEETATRHGGEARVQPGPPPVRKSQRPAVDARHGPRLPLAVEGEG